MYFPITIIDNFYEDFNLIKNYVCNLEYFDKQFPTMAGKTSMGLIELDRNLFNKVTGKILASYFGRRDGINFDCHSSFDKIEGYGHQYDKKGWIHTDDNNTLTGLLYIQGDYNEGTSFYKPNILGVCDYSDLEYKHLLYSGEQIEPNIYNEKLKEHNSNFEEILKVNLVPNRLVLFDSSIYHAADGFGSKINPRIIQTIFFRSIKNTYFPIPEINRVH
jgi:hypothetical protein